jgi:hypothetical protein
MLFATFNVDLACLRYISNGNKWNPRWCSLWSHQPFSERDSYNSRVVSIIYSSEGSIIPDKERTLPFPSCYTTSLIWQSRHNLLVFMNERDYEWTDIIVEGIRETSQTRVLWLSVTYLVVFIICVKRKFFLHSLADRILWEQGNPNHHTSFFPTKARRLTNPSPPMGYVNKRQYRALSTVKFVLQQRRTVSCDDIKDSIVQEQHGTSLGR